MVLDRLAAILAGRGQGPEQPDEPPPGPPRLPTVEQDSFPEQWGWVTTEERENLVMVARQSGKSSGAGLRSVLRNVTRPRHRTLYGTLTLPNCMQLFFEPTIDLLEKCRQPFKAKTSASDLQIQFPNGSRIYCRSIDGIRQARKARGPNWDDVILDEFQELDDHTAEQLVENILGPTLFRRKGSISLLFTPPTVQKGWLWKEFESGRWKMWNWAMAANRFLPPGEPERWLKKRGLTWESPVAKRELKGLWEPDVSNQVYDLDYVRNVYDELPTHVETEAGVLVPLDPKGWRAGIGEDIGWEHDDCIVVVLWHLHDPQRRLFEVFCWSEKHQDIDQTFVKFKEVWTTYRPVLSVVMDHAGAGGQKVIATVQNRFQAMGLPIEIEYKPASVTASVGLVNDNARTGRLLLRRNSPIWADVPHVVWLADSNRQEIDKGRFDSHRLDGLRYAVWGATNYLSRPAKKPLSEDEKRRQRRIAQARKGNRGW